HGVASADADFHLPGVAPTRTEGGASDCQRARADHRALPRRDETEEKRPPARGWQRLREGARGYSFRDAREGGMIRVTADAVGRRPCARTQPEPPSLAQHVACTGTLRAPAQRAGAGPKNWPGKPANGTRK
ncbi:unnamed protein product, partial [Prorocentrum cordatum]